MWLQKLREIEPSVTDVDIANLFQMSNDSKNFIFAMHVVSSGGKVLGQGQLEKVFGKVKMEDTAEWKSVHDEHDIEYKAGAQIHGACDQFPTECRTVTIKSSFCLDDLVIPFAEEGEYEQRVAHLEKIYPEDMEIFMSRMPAFTSSSVKISRFAIFIPYWQLE